MTADSYGVNGQELARRLLEDENDDLAGFDAKGDALDIEGLKKAIEAHFKPVIEQELKAKDWVDAQFRYNEEQEWYIDARVYDGRAWMDAQGIGSQVVTKPERTHLELGRFQGALLSQLRGAIRRANINVVPKTLRIDSMQWMGDQYTGHMDFMEDGPGNWELQFVFELDEQNPWVKVGVPSGSRTRGLQTENLTC